MDDCSKLRLSSSDDFRSDTGDGGRQGGGRLSPDAAGKGDNDNEEEHHLDDLCKVNGAEKSRLLDGHSLLSMVVTNAERGG